MHAYEYDDMEIRRREAEQRRLESLSDPEFLGEIVVAMAIENLSLNLPEVRESGGTFTCTRNTLIRSMPGEPYAPDTFSINAGTLERHRHFPSLTTRSQHVGLWPKEETAAIYDIEAAIAPSSTLVAAEPFMPIATFILDREGLEKIEDTTEAVTYYDRNGSPIGIDMGKFAVSATPETRIDAQIAGTPDYVRRVQTQELHLIGSTAIHTPKGASFRRVNDAGVQTSATNEESAPFIVEASSEKPLILNLEIPVDSTVHIAGGGAFYHAYKGESGSLSPSLNLPEAFAAAREFIPWIDATETFLQNKKFRALLLNGSSVPSAKSQELLTAKTRAAIEKALEQGPIHPTLTGCIAVMSALLEAPALNPYTYSENDHLEY